MLHALRRQNPLSRPIDRCLDRRVPRRELEQAAVIRGATPLRAADVEVPDLRGGYSYVIAALAAEGESTVRNVGIIRRGYEKFFAKLDALGADFDVIG